MTSFEQAWELAQHGKAPEAEALLRTAVTHTQDGTLARTEALYALANLLVACGDLARATAPLRTAVAMKSTSQDHEKARLTGSMNLGEILVRLGELEEADTVLRAGLDARRTFYGEDHAGYAYGLESLAKVEAARGNLESAVEHINEAVRIFWDDGNDRIAACFATRAPIVKAAGGQAFNQLAQLPEHLFDKMVSDVLQADDVEPRLLLSVLHELGHLAKTRPGAAAWLPKINAVISNVARDAGDHLARTKALGWLRDHMERNGEDPLGVMLALALAEDEGGNTSIAESHYQDAQRRAQAAPAVARSRVARNYGLFLSQHERKAEAQKFLDLALSEARAANDSYELGQAAIASGILLQHQSDPGAAPLLEEELRVLPADHPDALCARSHLIALRTGGGCGCGDMSEAVSDAVLEMVRAAVPPDLLADLQISLPDAAPPNINVRLAREPSEEEMQALDSAIHLAVAQLQQNIRRRGLGSAAT
ncbi:MAG TPA: tetratricopeptide repeat protein [Kofleriaceae bacterium]|nr:tetratricopeptide repeat protein [Kofleriaceae bacterium]